MGKKNMKAMKGSELCNCKPGEGIFGLILIVLGIYFGVWGFITQLTAPISWSMWNFNALLLYLLGALFLGFGKMHKHRGYGCCSMHKM